MKSLKIGRTYRDVIFISKISSRLLGCHGSEVDRRLNPASDLQEEAKDNLLRSFVCKKRGGCISAECPKEAGNKNVSVAGKGLGDGGPSRRRRKAYLGRFRHFPFPERSGQFRKLPLWYLYIL